MTVEMCLSTCGDKGFHYSGLQWQIECYCGNEPVDGFQWAWYDRCHDRCAGNSNQICGGSNTMSVYSTPKNNINGLCIYDFPYPRRVLSGLSIIGKNNMTIENCSEVCKDYEYFGLQNGDGCHCGDDATKFMPTYPSSCNKRCTGDRTQICGGNWRLTVYRNFITEQNYSLPQTTQPTEITTQQADTSTVSFSGELETSIDWNIDLKDSHSDLYQRTARNIQIDLETLFAEVDDVNRATVSIIRFEQVEPGRRRRQASVNKAKVIYYATLTVTESSTTSKIRNNIEFTIQNTDPKRFSSFDSFYGFIIELDILNDIDYTNSIIKTTTSAIQTAEWNLLSSTVDLSTSKPDDPVSGTVLVLSTLWSNNRLAMVVNLTGEFKQHKFVPCY